MKPFARYAVSLLLIDLVIFFTGFILHKLTGLKISLNELATLIILFSVIALTGLFVFFRGQTRSPDSMTLHTLVAVSLKFLLEISLAVIWFIVIKKTEPASVVLFFVLYLTLTMFWVFAVLKTLKTKP